MRTKAIYVDTKSNVKDDLFDEHIYTFSDTQGNLQEITITVSNNEVPKDEIELKYNENNPKDYYLERSTLDKSGMIWYVVKIIVLILLIALFFNKKLLNKVNISV